MDTFNLVTMNIHGSYSTLLIITGYVVLVSTGFFILHSNHSFTCIA